MAQGNVCTATWSAVPQNNPASGDIPAAPIPCPPSVVTVGINNVNAGPSVGAAFPTNWGALQFGTSFPTTSSSTIGIGTGSNYQISFSQQISNPLLYFNYIDIGDSFDFSGQSISLLQSNFAAISGASIISAQVGAVNQAEAGFIVQVLGSYGPSAPVNFDYIGSGTSVGFTAGVQLVPVPLPLMGVGVALGFSRNLRRRTRG